MWISHETWQFRNPTYPHENNTFMTLLDLIILPPSHFFEANFANWQFFFQRATAQLTSGSIWVFDIALSGFSSKELQHRWLQDQSGRLISCFQVIAPLVRYVSLIEERKSNISTDMLLPRRLWMTGLKIPITEVIGPWRGATVAELRLAKLC
jgi:hypothetical protein